MLVFTGSSILNTHRISFVDSAAQPSFLCLLQLEGASVKVTLIFIVAEQRDASGMLLKCAAQCCAERPRSAPAAWLEHKAPIPAAKIRALKQPSPTESNRNCVKELEVSSSCEKIQHVRNKAALREN